MKKNDNILIYSNKKIKDSNNNKLKDIKNLLLINNLDILKSLNLSINPKFKSENKNINPSSHKSLSSNKKPLNLNTSFKYKILKDINLLNNKMYSQGMAKPHNSMTTRYKSNEIKKKLLLTSIYNIKKEDNKYVIPKKYFNKKPLQTDYTNITMTQTLRNKLNEEFKKLQKQYHLLDKINYSNEYGKKKKIEFNDYANKNVIYNHPQLYYINSNRKGILPKIDYSIKISCLTEALPGKEEILNKSDLKNFNEYFKIKRMKKPLFIV